MSPWLAPPLRRGLLHEWRFDDSAADSVAGGNGAATEVTYLSGKIRHGARFNGSASRVVTGSLAKPAAWTVNCWIRPAAASPDAAPVAWAIGNGPGAQAVLFRSGNTTTWLLWNGATAPLTLQVPIETWSMVTITYDGAAARAYLGGSAVTAPTAHVIAPGTGAWYLGDYTGSNSYCGDLDEVTVWGRALTAAEVAALHNAGTGRRP